MPPIEIWVNGLVLSCIYITMAFGMMLVFSIMGLLNWSHGQFYMLGAYIVYFAVTAAGIPFLLSLAIAAVVMGAIGMIIQKHMMQRIEKSVVGQAMGPVYVGISTLALTMLFEGIATMAFGSGARGMTPVYKGSTVIGPASIGNQQIFIAVFTVVILLALYIVLNKTKVGLAIRAASQDKYTAGLYGINVPAIAVIVMGVGCALAAMAGGIVTPPFSIDPFIGMLALMSALLAIVIGGLGSLTGAVVGGLLLGFLGSVVAYYITHLYEIALFGLVIVILLVRPQGLFGRAER